MATPKQPLDRLVSRKKPIVTHFDLLMEDVEKPVEISADASKEERKAWEQTWSAYEVAVKEATERFSFRSLGRKPYDELVFAHPPTEEQRARAKKQGADEPDFNPDTFPPALLAASCISHDHTIEQWQSICDGDDDEGAWNMGEVTALFLTALEANQTRRVAVLGKGSGQIIG